MSGLLMAIAGALHPVSGAPKPPVQIILTSGTSWTVPSDWNNANNKVECIGAGRLGGGAWAQKNNIALTPGVSISYQIGATSSTQSVADSWFVSPGTVKSVGSIGTSGGLASSCVGDLRHSGGAFANNNGGGAGGPNGDGNPGGSAAGGSGDAGFGGNGGGPGQPGQPGAEWGEYGGSGGGGGYVNNTTPTSPGGNFGGGCSNGSGPITGASGAIFITYTVA